MAAKSPAGPAPIIITSAVIKNQGWIYGLKGKIKKKVEACGKSKSTLMLTQPGITL
jgi:hypothetical protein